MVYMVDRAVGRRFCSERGEKLVKIARFGKALSADLHLAGSLRKPNVAYPRPGVATGWPVM